MEKDKNGGPVVSHRLFESGMTLRDWFDGQSLAGMGTWTPSGKAALDREERAAWAYGQADAMLREREKAK